MNPILSQWNHDDTTNHFEPVPLIFLCPQYRNTSRHTMQLPTLLARLPLRFKLGQKRVFPLLPWQTFIYPTKTCPNTKKKKNDVTYVNKLKRVRYYCYQIVTWGKCQSVSNLPSHILSYLPSSCQKFRRVVVKSRRVCAFSFLFSFNFWSIFPSSPRLFSPTDSEMRNEFYYALSSITCPVVLHSSLFHSNIDLWSLVFSEGSSLWMTYGVNKFPINCWRTGRKNPPPCFEHFIKFSTQYAKLHFSNLGYLVYPIW